MKTKKILLLAGDGIGPEIMVEAEKVLNFFDGKEVKFEVESDFIGGISFDNYGEPLTDRVVDRAKEADAVLMGSVGGSKWDDRSKVPFEKRPEAGLLKIRKELKLFANLRPAIVFDELADASTLKKEVVAGLDILILRELIGGIYFGKPRGIERLDNGEERGYNTLEYSTHEIERIAKLGFELARKRNGRVCSVDKSNVLESMVLWKKVVNEIHKDYEDVDLSHMYVDNCAMQLVKNPKQFDVIITGNMFGDILSDCASMLTGSLGMLPSASLSEIQENGKRYAIYEPVHGSAPDIAGQQKANPIAQILSLSMMFKYSLDMSSEAKMIENAIKNVLAKNIRTIDIANNDSNVVSTSQMGDEIIKELKKIY